MNEKQYNLNMVRGYMAAELPDSADVFVPGETVADPPYLEDV